MLKDLLDIFIITYNRAQDLERTLTDLLNENSPIKDFEITIINNNSADNTEQVINAFAEKHSNIKHIKNRHNIGANGNITKAFYLAEKEYVWVLADNDYYDFDCWSEVERAINNKEEAVMVSDFLWPEADIMCLINQATFTPGIIYKTSNIDDTVIGNMAFNIPNWFPHLALFSKLINENKPIYLCSKGIVIIGSNIDRKTNKLSSFIRGHKNEDAHPLYKTMTWYSAYANTLYMIKDKKIRNYAAEHRMNGPALNSMQCIKEIQNKPLYMLMSVFCVLSKAEKFKFVCKWLYLHTLRYLFYMYSSYKRSDENASVYQKRLRIVLFGFIKICFKYKDIKRIRKNKTLQYKYLKEAQ